MAVHTAAQESLSAGSKTETAEVWLPECGQFYQVRKGTREYGKD